MPENTTTTRNPSGFVEDASVLTLFALLGEYLGGFTDDEQLARMLLIGTTIVGQLVATYIRNRLGKSIAEAMGLRVSRGTLVSLVLVGALGCAGGLGRVTSRTVDPDSGAVTESDCAGLVYSFGQSDVGDGCVGGEAISSDGASVVDKVLGVAGAVFKGIGGGLGG